MNRTKLILLFLALLAAIGLAGLTFSLNKPKSTIMLRYNLSADDASSIKLKLDDKDIKPQDKVTASKGPHTLTATKPGYKDFSATFTTGDANMVVNVSLQLTSDSTINNLEQIAGIRSTATTKLGTVSYFYDKTWAYVQITSTVTDPASIITHYDATTRKWSIALGPATSFDTTQTDTLPTDIQHYLSNNGLSSEGGE
jgi:hypothetical protein